MQDGSWIDVLERHKNHERQQILKGDPNSLLVRRCALGEVFADNPQQHIVEEQLQALKSTLASVQAEGYVPFILADESVAGSSIECLGATTSDGYIAHCVS